MHHTTTTLRPQQRKVADEIVMSICRGNYVQALKTLDYSRGILAAEQENILNQLLYRLQGMKKMDSLIACETLIDELQLPELNESVISSMDTQMPRHVLDRIYELMITLNFNDFYKQLENIQWVEHTIVGHTLILYKHCTRLKAAQKALDQLQLFSARKIELCILYALLIALGLYLVSFFF